MGINIVALLKLCNLETEMKLWVLIFYYVVDTVALIGVNLVPFRHKLSGISEHNMENDRHCWHNKSLG